MPKGIKGFQKGHPSYTTKTIKNKISIANLLTYKRGRIAWNKGIKQWEKKIPPMLGKHHSQETINKISNSLKGRKAWNKGKKGLPNTRKGKKFPQFSGKNHPRWKGRIKMQKGYFLVYKPEHPNCNKRGYILEHRLIMEKHLNRYLLLTERVHHINFNTSDNRIENLIYFENEREHQKYHQFLKHQQNYRTCYTKSSSSLLYINFTKPIRPHSHKETKDY